MTVQDLEPQAPESTASPTSPRLRDRLPKLSRRRWALVAAGAAAALAAGVGTAVLTSGDDAAPGTRTPSPTGTAAGPTPISEEAKARAKAAPMATTTSVTQAAGVQAHVLSAGSMPVNRRTLRVVSAKADLSAARELQWRADDGFPVGDARCTQTFAIGPKDPPGVRPTMMLCWRTSATRSAYAIAVSIDEKPSASATVKEVDKAWAALR